MEKESDIFSNSIEEIVNGRNWSEIIELVDRNSSCVSSSLGDIEKCERMGALKKIASRLWAVETIEKGNVTPEDQAVVDAVTWLYKYETLLTQAIPPWQPDVDLHDYHLRYFSNGKYENTVKEILKKLPSRPNLIPDPLDPDTSKSERFDM